MPLPRKKKLTLDELVDQHARFRAQAEEYGEIEAAIIMADREFDGDSDHASPKERLLDSIARLRSKADLADKLEAEGKGDAASMALLRGIGVGALHRWANSEEAGFKSPRARAKFVAHLGRAYAYFREDHSDD